GQEFPMKKYLRVAAGLSCLGVLILGAVALDPDGPLLSAFHGCAATRATLTEEIERKEHLKQWKEAVRRPRESKEHLAQEVIAQRRSLTEAMERFRALDQEWPLSRPTLAHIIHGSWNEVASVRV